MSPLFSQRNVRLPHVFELDIPPGHVVTVQDVDDGGLPTGAAPRVFVAPSPGQYDLLLGPDDGLGNQVDLHVVAARVQSALHNQPPGDA